VGKFQFETLEEQVARLKEFSYNPTQRVRTGLPEIDQICGGPAPGEVFMVLGRSYTGKSIVGQNIVVNNPDLGSIFFSLEMPYITALQRMYAMWSGTRHSDVLEMTETASLPEHIDFMADAFPMHRIVDAEALSLDAMSDYLNKYDEYYGSRPAFVVVDYLELLGGAKRSGEGWTATEVQATSLKDWAKAEEMRVFVLHQANRQEYSWKPPTENSARGAGYTESDFVVGLWQKWRDPDLTYNDSLYEANKMYFNVLKNRAYGKLGGQKEYPFLLEPDLMLHSVERDIFGKDNARPTPF